VLFNDKPLVIVLNKVDLCPFDTLSKTDKKLLNDLAKDSNSYLIKMSNANGEGITDVKEKACDILLDYRLSKKKDTTKIENRLHVGIPKKKDNKKREPHIPETVIMGIKKDGPSMKDL
jgi:nucleolar GTP-binding protein